MKNRKQNEFQVVATNQDALFTLKLHRGDGMTLLGMNWKNGKPSKDFVGFAIEYKEPEGDRFFPLKNRLSFPNSGVNLNKLSTRLSPIQKFRWVHFPRNADLDGEFTYKVTPVFMNINDELSYGLPQQAKIVLKRETYPEQLNIAFTRGFVSSQAFVDFYESAGPISKLLPAKAKDGLDFVPSHPKTKEALAWMGFESRKEIIELLDQAIDDKKAQVCVVAYDLNEPDLVSRFEKLKTRLKIIIDNDGAHGKKDSAENIAAKRLTASAGMDNVKRQHMGKLQHNKTITVNGPKIQAVICGSTNLSWRGLFVQSNNAVIIKGKNPVKIFMEAFDNYWENDTPKKFGNTKSAEWNTLDLKKIDINVCFSPHSSKNAVLEKISIDIDKKTTSNLLFSLAFLYQTKGFIRKSITKVTKNKNLFIYGISDKKVGGLDIQKPDGNIAPLYPSALVKNIPEPFKLEPTGGGGNRMHHKFVVIDFDKPTARVYTGSYNFSSAADTGNGENLLLIKDRRIAVSYVIEALRIFDHYHFRITVKEAKKAKKKLALSKPPHSTAEMPWWSEYYTNNRKIRDRELFS